jgi:hypothetical protein
MRNCMRSGSKQDQFQEPETETVDSRRLSCTSIGHLSLPLPSAAEPVSCRRHCLLILHLHMNLGILIAYA